MKNYKIKYGSGLAWIYEEVVEVEDFEYEKDALDKLIDNLEKRGYMGCFASQEEIDNGKYNEDEYVIGGNHGKYLLHFGNLNIEGICA